METGRPARGETRREELLDALVALFTSEGFLHLSLEDLAARLRCSKSTLYRVAPSKEQLFTAVVRTFFRRSTDRVETELAAEGDPGHRIVTYLSAISAALAPASPAFYADLEAFAPTREIYRANTAAAARRVQDLASEMTGPAAVDPVFVGAAAGAVMTAIQSGDVSTATGLDDATAYRHLAELLVAGTRGP